MTQTTLDSMTRVSISKARHLYDAGRTITLYPSNVNDYHIFEGWRLGLTIRKDASGFLGASFDEIVSNFKFYMDPELGRYVKFLAHN